jgi:hypothetical protein
MQGGLGGRVGERCSHVSSKPHQPIDTKEKVGAQALSSRPAAGGVAVPSWRVLGGRGAANEVADGVHRENGVGRAHSNPIRRGRGAGSSDLQEEIPEAGDCAAPSGEGGRVGGRRGGGKIGGGMADAMKGAPAKVHRLDCS